MHWCGGLFVCKSMCTCFFFFLNSQCTRWCVFLPAHAAINSVFLGCCLYPCLQPASRRHHGEQEAVLALLAYSRSQSEAGASIRHLGRPVDAIWPQFLQDSGLPSSEFSFENVVGWGLGRLLRPGAHFVLVFITLPESKVVTSDTNRHCWSES